MGDFLDEKRMMKRHKQMQCTDLIDSNKPLRDSCLENPMDRGAWQATVHRAAKS